QNFGPRRRRDRQDQERRHGGQPKLHASQSFHDRSSSFTACHGRTHGRVLRTEIGLDTRMRTPVLTGHSRGMPRSFPSEKLRSDPRRPQAGALFPRGGGPIAPKRVGFGDEKTAQGAGLGGPTPGVRRFGGHRLNLSARIPPIPFEALSRWGFSP